jgi:Sec7-like guanine-nucleotide exchange factor
MLTREEMDSQPAPPRVFSMQKIVEITYYNMSRIRIVWSRIWAILGQHFQSVALRKDEQLSMYAIDAMRQLAFKFLEKEELTSFHFQVLILLALLVQKYKYWRVSCSSKASKRRS